ncbi:PDDEXK family nuclease [Thiohalomonas denitrificans]|uniref:Endonuclease NucS n=1 Tax=Thiohalomonas denitrificans TaxID=415747 RepID=A0A1G5R2T0_9GAMM|nr:hypothetical protein [Thiohalomonas denitrificans]SCZ68383.1 hypothetical protein SAMN03097708_03308 [Thiohalomonas denitrificans]
MALYEMDQNSIRKLRETTFVSYGLKERGDIQRLLKERIEVIAPGTMVLAEEFGEWEASRRRIDLLGLDKDANLVVVELKRTEDGGHMELQALRYAAMVSTMTFDKVVEIYERHLGIDGADVEARTAILDFLEWDEVDEDSFAQDVRIVLASAEFSRELTTTVMWLNEHNLDITCVRLKPYDYDGRLILDVQPIIPLPEAEEYQVRVRDKVQKERKARESGRDLTRYDVFVDDDKYPNLAKRRAILAVFRGVYSKGANPEDVAKLIDWKPNLVRSAEGTLGSGEMYDAITEQLESEGKTSTAKRYFLADDELMHANGRTYALTKMWGRSTVEAMQVIVDKYSDLNVCFREAEI